MDFNLSEERRMLRDMLQRLLSERYSHDARRKLLASGAAYDTEILSELADLGILGAMFSEADNGFGGTGFDIAVVFEELGRSGVIEPVLATAVLGGALIARLGNDTQRHLIDQIISGQTIIALAHNEPGARYDIGDVSSRAVADGDDIVINGTKTHVINGAQADHLVVSVRMDTEIVLFLVSKDTRGLSIVNHANVDGTSGARLQMTDLRVSKAQQLGGHGTAFTALNATMARATLAVSAEALGAMEAAKDLTVTYLKERRQFGMPIGKFQVLQHRMADVLIEIEQARSAVINLAGHLDAEPKLRDLHVSATKNLIGRVGALVAEEAIQLHGGIGMTDEYALSYFARRLTMIDHMFGDVDYHIERFIQLSSA